MIGAQTAYRPYVQYEISESYNRGNGLLGVRINNIKDSTGNTDWLTGPNPFDQVNVDGYFGKTQLSLQLSIPIYDWVNQRGRENIASWIADAPKKQ
ncbi:MAG: TIR domain-containing protein [Pseudomonadota bacterium]